MSQPLSRYGTCRCLQPATHQLSWECAAGHARMEGLCEQHAQQVAGVIALALLMCGKCQERGIERPVGMTAVDGRAARRKWA